MNWPLLMLCMFVTAAPGVCADVLPAFTETAVPEERLRHFRAEIDGRLSEYSDQLDAAEKRINEVFGKQECLQRERAFARLEVARTLPGYIRRNLRSSDPDGVRYAYMAAEDMCEFVRYFDEELACWDRFPREKRGDDPGNAPKVFDLVRDFGAKGDGATDTSPAWARAIAAISARNGAPTVLNIPEGRFLFSSVSHKRQLCNMPIVALSNLLVRGVSPERTWLVAGIYGRPSMQVSGCYNVAVRDVSITTVDPTYCQGKVLSVDVEKAQLEIQHDPKTLRPDEKRLNSNKKKFATWQCCTAYDDSGRILRTQTISWIYDPAVDLGNGRFRLQMDPKRSLMHLKPGMNLVLPNRVYPASAASIRDYSAFCSMERVHVRRSYAAAFGGAGRYASYKDCRVFPEKGFIYATNADSMMTCGGLYLSGFDVNAPGDDCINNYVPSYRVSKVLDRRRVSPGRMHGLAGDGRLRTFTSVKTCQYLSLNRVVTNACQWACNLQDDLPDSITNSSVTCDTRAFGVGTVIRNCRFRNARAGCSLQMPNLIMEDCSFENIVHGSGVRIGCHVREGNPPYNVTIRRVKVKNAWAGFMTERIGAGSTCAAPIHGITVEDCDVADVVLCHWFRHASDVVMKNVKFSGETLEKNAFGERTNEFWVDKCGAFSATGVSLNGVERPQ